MTRRDAVLITEAAVAGALIVALGIAALIVDYTFRRAAHLRGKR